MATFDAVRSRARMARWSALAVVPLLVASAVGCGPAQPDAAPTSSLESATTAAVVSVAFRDVRGAQGGAVAGVLYRGTAPVHPDTLVIGGFGVSVASEPWSDDQVVRRPLPEIDTGQLFPYVTDEPLPVEPGTYTLVVYLSSEPLSPYSRWVPSGAFGALTELWGCQATFTVDRSDITVTVTSVPRMTGTVPPCA